MQLDFFSTKKPRGFATLSKERRAEISRLGGIAAHQKGFAHVFNSETAKEAGRKGGIARSKDRQVMKDIGRLGGLKGKGKKKNGG